MAKSATMTIRLDPEVKSAAEEIYSHFGMTLTEAISIFLHQSLNVGGLPFNLRPSPDTLEAIREVKQMKNNPERFGGYATAQQMFDDILSEND
jgi:DNA-damage-inducible protein J